MIKEYVNINKCDTNYFYIFVKFIIIVLSVYMEYIQVCMWVMEAEDCAKMHRHSSTSEAYL